MIKTVRNHLSDPEKKVFNSLLSASLAVCESLGFKFDWAKVLASQLSAKILSEHREKMRYDTGFKIGGVLLLPKKLKANFQFDDEGMLLGQEVTTVESFA